MLAIGNTKPDNIIVGRNDASTASWNATCCESARVEIISPRPSAPARYNDRARISRIHEPFIGSPKSPIDASTIASDVASEMAKYGNVLPMMYSPVPSGAILTCSIVPRSFSRTTERDVEMTAEIMPMYAMRPG
jgi:hypothetical protein